MGQELQQPSAANARKSHDARLADPERDGCVTRERMIASGWRALDSALQIRAREDAVHPEFPLAASLYRRVGHNILNSSGGADVSETLDNARVGRLAGVPGGVRGFAQRHPEWWAMLAAAGAWGLMIVLPHPHAGHHGHAPPAGPGALATAVMVVAMMLPLTIPNIRHVALSSARRHRGIAGFLAGYLAVWMLAMLVISATWTLTASLAGWAAAAAGTVAVAALWEVARPMHRHADQGHRAVPLTPGGWRADVDCARYGVTSGISCVGACWALMTACVAFAHSLPVMVVLFGVQLSGRYGRRSSTGLAALAVLVTGLAALAARIAGGHAV